MIVKGHCETLFSTWNGLETVLPVDRELEQDTSSGRSTFWSFFYLPLSLCHWKICHFIFRKIIISLDGNLTYYLGNFIH